MNITILPRKLSGTIPAVASKSHMQRLLICAALADGPTDIYCGQISDDIRAAVACLTALGAQINEQCGSYHVIPIGQLPETAALSCGESGAVLRFLLPVVGALGIEATFELEGRLADRPLDPLLQELERHGCRFGWSGKNRLHCAGQLCGGTYTLPGNISSQFISGLKMAFPRIEEPCALDITGNVASRPYIQMTDDVLKRFGIADITCKHYRTPGTLQAEGDWSSAAFFYGANALGSDVAVTGLSADSTQADRAITSVLPQLAVHTAIDAADFPDLVPILAVIAAANKGAVFTNISRLRLKESDRITSICEMLSAFGIATDADENTLTVHPGHFGSCTVDSFHDHRIAMAAAIAASVAQGPVTIRNAQCVSKSYPRFWEDYRTLGGCYEFHLR